MDMFDRIGRGLAGFGAGYEGHGMQYLQQLQDEDLKLKQQAALQELSTSNNPEQIMQSLASQSPEALLAYAKFKQEQLTPKAPMTNGLPEGYMWQDGQAVRIQGVAPKPQLPQTAGLPEGYMWNNGQAVRIPGVSLKAEAPLSPIAKLTADYKAGLIDEETYKRTVAKETAPVERQYKQFQLQAASFADRMSKAEQILQPIEQSGADVVNEGARTAAAIPSLGLGEVIGNSMLSEEQQAYKNAASEWIRSKLRKESGSAIPENEMEQEYRTYFPVAGDKPEVIKQKAMLRKVNTQSMIKQASGAYEDQYGMDSPQVDSTINNPAPDKGGKVLIFDKDGNIVQ